VVQSCGPADLDNKHGGRDGIAEKQEQERLLQPDQLEYPAANLLQRQHLVGAQVCDPVIDDAGLEEGAKHGVDRLNEVRATVEHELCGVRAQQTARQEPYGNLDFDALSLGYGVVVHEPLHFKQSNVTLYHQTVDDQLEVCRRQQLEPLHERPRYPRSSRRRVHYVHRPRRGHRDQRRV